MDTVTAIVFGLVGLGMVFSIIRLIKGPQMSDRVVSLDTFNVITIGLLGLLSLVFKNALYLDIAIIYAILAFLETVVFARYMEAKYGNR